MTSQTYTKDHFTSLYHLFKNNNDDDCANDLLDIYEKYKNNELNVTFAGHFSAGKSSMINTLLEEDILPNSPIPTSANIVKITSGSGYARVFFHHDSPLEYKAPYDIDMIKQYCQNKDTIQMIELNTVNDILPKGCVIIDTPGIDAADDADRVLTESSLHLVDLLFYVMDYNHVQSEVNLLFLKQLQTLNIPFYLVVNQIDKHREEEIPFESFKESIEQAFDQWDISPLGVYYTSLIDHELPMNELSLLKDKLLHIFTESNQSTQHIDRSIHHIIHKHKQFLRDNYKEKLAEFESNDHNKSLDSDVSRLQDELNTLRHQFTQFEQEFQHELTTTLQNAYLMPFDMRERAQAFLDSQQSDFKVGWFRSKQKTNAEQKKRLEDFWKALETTINSTITWRLRDKFKRLIDAYEVTDEDIVYMSQHIDVNFSAQHLVDLINPGARVTGEYVLNYTDQVSAAIKQMFKQETGKLWKMIQVHYEQLIDRLTNVYSDQQKALNQIKNLENQRSNIQAELQHKITAVNNLLTDPQDKSLYDYTIDTVLHAKYEHITEATTPIVNTIVEKESSEKDDGIVTVTIDDSNNNRSIEQTTQAIDETIRIIESLPGFDVMINDLREKRDRLTHRKLTVALFGAFSAGKSSFANALMGHNVLPSSPNPTTAVVTRIHPISDIYAHGTVLVTLKSEQEVTADLRMMTKDFSPPKCSLKELIKWIQTENIHKNDRLNRMYQSYIHAVITGYDHMWDRLGKQITIKLNDFARFSTNETKACFIQQIDLYYECSITNKGITLVDTPGADSINARHTDVSFNFIKEADAIIYVTYYNHALSRADKDFLLQLGRVKESFELDKMFFIINAADLAKNESELDLVVEYVEDELQKLGIRFPAIFPLSSKNSLNDKLNHKPVNEQMAKFEASFQQFINHDLAQLATQSAYWDIKRVHQSLKQYIDTVALDEQERTKIKDRLKQTHTKLHEMIEKVDTTIYIKQTTERISRQLHYVHERFAIRFHDFFRDAFNPTTITTSKRSELESCLRTLLDHSGYELLQEMRAVSLRVEATMRSLANDLHDVLKDNCLEIDTQFILPMYDVNDIQTPNYEQAFQAIPLSTFNRALRLFRGTKAFFEQRESDQMKEEIYFLLMPYIETYINEHNQMMEHAYLLEWEHLFSHIKKQTRKHIDDYLQQQQLMLSDAIDQHMLEEKEQKLQLIIDNSEVRKDNRS